MPHTLSKTVYYFDELSDKAKEKARDWWRAGSHDDTFWSESVIEDAKECGKILGITVDDVYWSGFSSQGDGAQFVGSYVYAKGAAERIREHAPQDERLHDIADRLQEVQRRHFYRLEATVTSSGHYSHEYCTDINIDDMSRLITDANDDKELKDTLRDFMRWIYRQLEQGYEYEMSNEVVDENIKANEYEFTEDGRRAV